MHYNDKHEVADLESTFKFRTQLLSSVIQAQSGEGRGAYSDAQQPRHPKMPWNGMHAQRALCSIEKYETQCRVH